MFEKRISFEHPSISRLQELQVNLQSKGVLRRNSTKSRLQELQGLLIGRNATVGSCPKEIPVCYLGGSYTCLFLSTNLIILANLLATFTMAFGRGIRREYAT